MVFFAQDGFQIFVHGMRDLILCSKIFVWFVQLQKTGYQTKKLDIFTKCFRVILLQEKANIQFFVFV